MKYFALIFLSLFLTACDKPNSKPTYGDSGLPKNCRAIIKANVEAYQEVRTSQKDYGYQLEEIDGIFSSIDRNCGEFGWSWENE